MKRDSNQKAPERRSFLSVFGSVATLAAAAAASPLMARRALAMNPGKAATKAQYRLSDDVKNFYRTNRY
ncbi:MAG: hypothetical protein ACREFO_05455 [Acetobacteraceae bacterium]